MSVRSTPSAPARESLPAARAHTPRGTPRTSKRSRWRAVALIAVHVLVLVHVAQWRVQGSTMTPLEPSEAMQTFELGYVNAGFILFMVATLATLILGRFFCGWACHVVAYQDAAAWFLGKLGLRPRPIRSRLLVWVPLCAALYMFLWPTLARLLEGREFAGFRPHFSTENFWASFPGPGIALLTFFVDGFLIVYLLGAKGFCTYGCPYGAVFAVAERASHARIRVTDACEGCGHCTATCTSNVQVHAEVARFGQVIDTGCMKCMDCISVCPKDALYFGFGESRGAALTRKGAKSPTTQRAYDFSAREEVSLASVFLLSLFALRGLYDLVPFLLAIGLAVISALLAVLSWRLLRSERVQFQGRELATAGRRTPLGQGTLALGALWFIFVGHSMVVQTDVTVGRWLLLEARELAPGERNETLARSLSHLDRAAGLGLRPVATLEFQRGQILARLGSPQLARERLQRALELDSGLQLARMELAELALADPLRAGDGAREQLERVLADDPAHSRARELLARIEFLAAQTARLAGDLLLSERHLRAAVELEPGLAPAQLDLADLCMSKSPADLAGARAALAALLAVDPQQAEALRRSRLLDERFGPAR